MPEIETVGTVTEEDLRRAAMSAASRYRKRTPVLAAHEFTISDWIGMIREQDGMEVSDSTAERELEILKATGVLGGTKGQDRYDPRTKRVVKAYWYMDGDGQEEGGVGYGTGDPGRGPP